MYICEISILICQKLGLVGPIQQRIKLPLPNVTSFTKLSNSNFSANIAKFSEQLYLTQIILLMSKLEHMLN